MLLILFLSTCVSAQSLSCVQLFATRWTVGRQAPLSMGFSRQKYWSGLLLGAALGITDKMEAWPQLLLFVLQARTQDEGVRPCDSDFFSLSLAGLTEKNIKVLIVLERSMRRHKAFCSCAQRIIHKVNHWHSFKDLYKRVFQDEHIGRSLRPWERLLSETYLWGKCLWQRSLLNLGLRNN